MPLIDMKLPKGNKVADRLVRNMRERKLTHYYRTDKSGMIVIRIAARAIRINEDGTIWQHYSDGAHFEPAAGNREHTAWMRHAAALRRQLGHAGSVRASTVKAAMIALDCAAYARRSVANL